MNKKDGVLKGKKLKEIITYIWSGFLLSGNLVVGGLLVYFRNSYFNMNINFGNTLELGFFIVKMGLLVGVLAIDLKTLSTINKRWKEFSFVEKEDKRIAEKEIKRVGLIRRLWFQWRTYEARKWMDKYNEVFGKLKKSIGRIKGNETKELVKLKNEMIKGILLWREDFQITRVFINKKGDEVITDIPVDEDFLNQLYIDEIYENYLIRCVESAERFINGVTQEEIIKEI